MFASFAISVAPWHICHNPVFTWKQTNSCLPNTWVCCDPHCEFAGGSHVLALHSNMKPPSGALMCRLISLWGGGTERFTVAEIWSNASGDNASGCAVRAEPVHVKRRRKERKGAQYLTSGRVSSQLGGCVSQFWCFHLCKKSMCTVSIPLKM